MTAPFSYEFINETCSQVQPSMVQIRNTGLARFFKRYLMQEAISVYDWKLPETWDADYFRYVLMGWGYLCVFNTDLFGVIPQQCTLSGYNVFYRPTRAIVTNPLITTRDLTIGTDCEIIKLMPDYGSIADLVDNYGNLMALAYESAAINILNSRVSFVFQAQDKAEADTYKALYDSIASGDPAVVYRKGKKTASLDAMGQPWNTFSQNVGANFIAPDIMETIRQIRDEFMTEIGIPNLSTRKKERVSVDESEKNTFETQCKAMLWLDELKSCVEKVNSMFGLSLAVYLKSEEAEAEEDKENEANSFNPGSV